MATPESVIVLALNEAALGRFKLEKQKPRRTK